MFDNLISMLQSWGEFFLGLWESDWMGIQSIFTTLWSRVEVLFSLGLDVLNEVFQLFANLFTGDWSAVWQNLLNILTGVVQGISLFFAAGLEALVNLLINIGEALWDAGSAAFAKVSEAFSTKWEEIKVWFEGAKNDPVTAIEGIASAMYEAGKTVITKLWDGLKAAWEAVAAWADGIASWLTDILSVSADVTVNTHGGGGGSFASGLDYVPRDMYVKVHEGESIRTKQQTREDAQGSRGGGDNFYFYSPEPIDEMEAAKQMKRAKRDLAEGF
jgi:phage-related protein